MSTTMAITHTDSHAGSEVVVTETDCGTDVGMTVGLIDSLIFICRVLAPRLRMPCGDQEEQPIIEALRDLSQDKAVCWVWDHRPHSQDEETDLKLLERMELFRKRDKRTAAENARLQELNAFADAMPLLPEAALSRYLPKLENLVRDTVKELATVRTSG